MSKAAVFLGAALLFVCILFFPPQAPGALVGTRVALVFGCIHGLPTWGLLRSLSGLLRPLDKRLSTPTLLLAGGVMLTLTLWTVLGHMPLGLRALKTSLLFLGTLSWSLTPRRRGRAPWGAVVGQVALAAWALWADTTQNLTALALRAKAQSTRVVATLVELGLDHGALSATIAADNGSPGAQVVTVFPASDAPPANVVTLLTGQDPFVHGVRQLSYLSTHVLHHLRSPLTSQGPLWAVDTQGSWPWASHLSTPRGPCGAFSWPWPRWLTHMALDIPAAWETVLTPEAPCFYHPLGPSTPVFVRQLQRALKATPPGETLEIFWLMATREGSNKGQGWHHLPKVSTHWPRGVVDLQWLALPPYPLLGAITTPLGGGSVPPLLLPLGALRAWTKGRPPPQMAYTEVTQERPHPAQFLRVGACAQPNQGTVEVLSWDPLTNKPVSQVWEPHKSQQEWRQESLAPCGSSLAHLLGQSLEADVTLFEKGPQYALRFRQAQGGATTP